jgi:hypothetical protein
MANGEKHIVFNRIARRAKAFFKRNKKATWQDFFTIEHT